MKPIRVQYLRVGENYTNGQSLVPKDQAMMAPEKIKHYLNYAVERGLAFSTEEGVIEVEDEDVHRFLDAGYMMHSLLKVTQELLKEKFPNLTWVGHENNRDHYHFFVAKFAKQWRLDIEVRPFGSMATLTVGNQIVSCSPNTQGETVQKSVQVIVEDWEEISQALSSVRTEGK